MTGDDSDENPGIIRHGDKVLASGQNNEIFHLGVESDGFDLPLVRKLRDGGLFRFFVIQICFQFDKTEKIAFRYGVKILALLIQNGDCRQIVRNHLLGDLAEGPRDQAVANLGFWY